MINSTESSETGTRPDRTWLHAKMSDLAAGTAVINWLRTANAVPFALNGMTKPAIQGGCKRVKLSRSRGTILHRAKPGAAIRTGLAQRQAGDK